MTRGARTGHIHQVRALLLARVDYGEADLVVTLFSDSLGRVSALARGARRSRRRFAGSLEPMHTLQVRIEERPGGDLFALREATLDRARHRLTGNLDALDAAGTALIWLKKAAPARTAEPLAWSAINRFLDTIDEAPEQSRPRLVALGFQLLEAFGWGLDLMRCVRCGKACPEKQAALVSPERGGLVCRACGGGPLRISGSLRSSLVAAVRGEDQTLPAEDLDVALKIVERALSAHMGFE